VYNGTTFKVISASTASPTAPTSNVAGDLWFDTVNGQLKVYNGSTFILVGPASTSGQGTSGAVVTTVTDNTSVDHVVVQLYVNNTIVAIVSKDATFTPQVAITGFATIGPGIQLSSTVSSALFRGTSTDAQLLDGIDSTGFLSSTSNDTTSGTLGILNDTGLTVGVDQDFQAQVITANSAVILRNQTQNANLSIRVNAGGTDTAAISINGTNAQITIPQNMYTHSILNAQPAGVGNIGNSTQPFNTVFAISTSALYADVAERFESDTAISPGSVVELGGLKEITISQQELSENVFGVVSTRAAYLMNAGAGTDETHPAVAVTGRVPVRVIGKINKGDRLVSAGGGIARAAKTGEATPFNTIGRALQDKSDHDAGTIEAIVMIK